MESNQTFDQSSIHPTNLTLGHENLTRESTAKHFNHIPKSSPQMGDILRVKPNQMLDKHNESHYQIFGVKSPKLTFKDPFSVLKKEINYEKTEFSVKVIFPKKFEALRRFYCGSNHDFLQSLISSRDWTNVSGGKTKSKFYKSFDDKYVFKEIKKGEFKMFLDFAP